MTQTYFEKLIQDLQGCFAAEYNTQQKRYVLIWLQKQVRDEQTARELFAQLLKDFSPRWGKPPFIHEMEQALQAIAGKRVMQELNADNQLDYTRDNELEDMR